MAPGSVVASPLAPEVTTEPRVLPIPDACSSSPSEAVECKIEQENVDPWLAHEPQGTAFDAPVDEGAHRGGIQPPGAGHPGHLQERAGWRNVRIEPGA